MECALSQKLDRYPQCGEKHSMQQALCMPTCILCRRDHLIGTGSCKARPHQPPRQTSLKLKPAMPTAKELPPPVPHQDWTKAARAPQTSLSKEEVAILREGASYLRATINSISSPTPPTFSYFIPSITTNFPQPLTKVMPAIQHARHEMQIQRFRRRASRLKNTLKPPLVTSQK